MGVGLWVMGMALAAAQAAAEQEPKQPSDALHQALECRVYIQLAKSVHAAQRDMLAMDEKLHRYWMERGDTLARKEGIDPKTLFMRQLVIRLEADRFTDVMINCLKLTPKKALR